MSSHTYDYLDGNAAAGELSKVFAMDITVAEGRCAHCGATKCFAEARLYMRCPGVVARCPGCHDVVMRYSRTATDGYLDLRGTVALRVRLDG